MRLNVGTEGPQLSILRHRRPLRATPAKERVICADIYRHGKLISCTTSGEAFKSPHLQDMSGETTGGQGLSKIIYTYRPYLLRSLERAPTTKKCYEKKGGQGLSEILYEYYRLFVIGSSVKKAPAPFHHHLATGA